MTFAVVEHFHMTILTQFLLCFIFVSTERQVGGDLVRLAVTTTACDHGSILQ
jgi:hypothetical protein